MPSTENPGVSTDHTADAFKRRFMVRFVTVLIGGMFLDGFILGILGTVITPITHELNFSDLWEGLVAASALLGIMIGAPLAGWAGDKWGRKPLFMADMGLFVAASVLQFFVDSAWQLFVVRLLMGIAIGAEYAVGWPLMSEFSPARLRGRLLCGSEVAWYVGFMVAFLVGYILTTSTDVSWRIILGTSTLIALVLFIARIGLPESPRWLWNVGRRDEAVAIANKYMMESKDITDIAHEDTRKGTFGMLFSRQYWRSTLFVSGFWFCSVTPYFAIATFAESVLKNYGLSSGLAGGLGLSAVAAAGVVVTVLYIDKIGRRILTVPPQWLCTVVLAIIGLWAGAPPVIVLVLFLVFSFFNAMYTAITGLYPAEVFPTEIRGLGTGFGAAVSRLGAAAGTFLLPWSMTNLGTSVTMLIAAGVALVGAALSQWLCPETMGKNLSDTAVGVGH
ncbi:MFS transporter [Mycobacterium dioxanotrophicus]|jgi:putative MFS transporter|uniref:MFS transporter n=1 Tax=Mycobacterium dioxanotrophicus TaxID=482462 RepID=A0A1Y0C6U8_9MYCO|nr:MFS transporter [Mycobacterium dioxanotrophicus]ART70786.1 MFS transporter [Mycobacterium dioxanotrophicus]